MKHKKAEGTPTSLFITIFAILIILVMINGMIVSFAGRWSVEDIPEFEVYSDLNQKSINLSQDIIGEINPEENATSSPIDTLEDNMFSKGFKFIYKFPQMLKYAGLMIQNTFISLKFLPSEVYILVFTILGVTVASLVIRSIMRYNKI